MRQPEGPLPFSLDEYADRIKKVRQRLVERNLDALLVYWPENIYYLSGLNSIGYTNYQVLVLPVDRDPFFVARSVQVDNVHKFSCVDEIDVYRDGGDPVEATIEALKKRGLDQKRLGVELDAWFLTPRIYLKLAPVLNLVDASQLVNWIRLVKSPRELEYMREAVRAMEAGAAAGLAAIRPGATENDVAAALLAASVKAGSEYTGHAPLISTDPQRPRSGATWEGKRIEAGDLMMFEPGASVQRYHGLVLRFVSVGTPRDERIVRMAQVAAEGLTAAIEFIKAGVTSHEAAVVAKEPVRRAGLVTGSVNRCGYAVGIGYPPDWGEGRTLSILEGDHTVLEANMTFHIQNSVYYEGLKFNISETIRITETGCEVMTTLLPRELIVV